METKLRPRKHHRNVCLYCLPFFSLMLGLAVYFGLAEHRPASAIFGGGFWACWICLGIYGLMEYYKSSLTIDDARLLKRGPFREQCLAWSEISVVKWVRRAVVLTSVTNKLTVDLNYYTEQEQRWLVQLIRRRLPTNIQQGWDLFCFQFALPQERRARGAPLEQGELLLTRQRYDRVFGCLLIMMAGGVGLLIWLLRAPQLLVSLVFVVGLWLFLRFSIPAQGASSRKIRFLEFPVPLLLMSLGPVLLTMKLLGTEQTPLLVACAFGIVGVVLHSIWFESKQEARRRAEAPTAAQKWERLVASDPSPLQIHD